MNEDELEYQLMSPLGITLDDNSQKSNKSNKSNKRKKTASSNNKKFFDKIIIPYNFKKNNYLIQDEEIDGYENKEFVLNTLHSYNYQEIFKFDSPYNPSVLEKILFYIPVCLISFIIFYIIILICIRFLFNPLFIYVLYKCIRIIFSLIKGLKNTIYEKLKKKAINKILEETNNSEYCQEHKIHWNLGVSGYWLEIEKIRQDNELQERKI